jgi:hypothetical protein
MSGSKRNLNNATLDVDHAYFCLALFLLLENLGSFTSEIFEGLENAASLFCPVFLAMNCYESLPASQIGGIAGFFCFL